MKLIIVESPNKTKTIEGFLGKEYKVTSSVGHILDLPKKGFGINLDTFDMKFEVMQGKEGVVQELKRLIAKSDEVIIATDDDREGEAIALHVSKLIPKGKPYKRIIFDEITKKIILEALGKDTKIDFNMCDAQKTRRMLDRIVGYKISPLLWKNISPELSAGRVQSVGLRIVLEREKQIRKFIPDEYFTIDSFVKEDIKISYYGDDLDKKDKIVKKDIADAIMENIKDKSVFVLKKESKEIKEYPKPPFSTLDLQQETYSKLGLGSKKTMEIAQKLYEGKNLKDLGTHGLISYMRTDSYRINDDKMKEINELVASEYPEFQVSKNYSYSKSGASQDAHEAIRPTYIKFNPEKIKEFLSEEEFSVYSIIWKRFISSQMKPAIFEQSNVYFKIDQHIFLLTGKLQKSKGYLTVYDYVKKNDVILPSFDEGEEIPQSKAANLKSNFTKPPQRYTEATFLKVLEKKGIGRPSTYSAIVENLTGKKYIKVIENKYHISKVGEIICESLLSSFSKIFELNFTAKIEKELDLIAEGKLDYKELLENFWKELKEEIRISETEMLSLKEYKIPMGTKCSQCEAGTLSIHVKGISRLKCDRCDFSQTGVLKNKKFKEKKIKQKICVQCDEGFLVERHGRYGKFLACNSNLCDFISPITTGVKCMVCSKGEYVERTSKKGNLFYTCSLKHCDGVLFNKIVKKKCVHCANPFLIKKDKKNDCPFCKKINE